VHLAEGDDEPAYIVYKGKGKCADRTRLTTRRIVVILNNDNYFIIFYRRRTAKCKIIIIYKQNDRKRRVFISRDVRRTRIYTRVYCAINQTEKRHRFISVLIRRRSYNNNI